MADNSFVQCKHLFPVDRCCLPVDHQGRDHEKASDHNHNWIDAGSPMEGIGEYVCYCGAEKQVVSVDEEDGTTVTTIVWLPAIDHEIEEEEQS